MATRAGEPFDAQNSALVAPALLGGLEDDAVHDHDIEAVRLLAQA